VIDLQGKVAIVTGAASGLGAATATLFAQLGAAVVLADVDGEGAGRLASQLGQEGGTALACRVDVRDEAQVAGMIDTAVREFGGLDVLHNNAALMGWDFISRDTMIETMDAAVWDETHAVSLRGAMLGCKHAVPAMRTRGGGSIISTASTSGLTGEMRLGAYGAAKAGIINLMRSVATMYGHENIRANAIAPGMILSPATYAAFGEKALERRRMYRLVPRGGAPSDVANLAAFLASDLSTFITGQVITVDGGMLAHHPSYMDNLEELWATHSPSSTLAGL
jgi:NAD(P)-dependent dehydrogenase (short-subunit alcohol dehydrogenase family)